MQRINTSSKLSNLQANPKSQKTHQGTFIQPSNTVIEDLTGTLSHRRTQYNRPKQKSYLLSANDRGGPVDVTASNAFSLSEAIASEGLHNKEHFEINEEKNNLYNYQNARDLIVRG